MNKSDKKEFFKLIHPLVVSFPYPMVTIEDWKEKLEIYFKTLMPYKFELVEGAVNYLLLNRTRTDFPNPAEIVKAMEKYLDQKDLIMGGEHESH